MHYTDQMIAHALLADSGVLRTGRARKELIGQYRVGGPRVYTPRVESVRQRSDDMDRNLLNEEREVTRDGHEPGGH